MNCRSLGACVCTIALLAAGPARAGEISECALMAEGRADLTRFAAQMADGTRVSIQAMLVIPEGSGPFPAMVILPGGSRLYTPSCYRAIVERFVSWGFATFFVAPTTARDDDGARRFQYSFADLESYAQGAASAAAALPQIDATRMGLWGHSRGGLPVIVAVSGSGEKSETPFRAAVAVAPWPGCPTDAFPPSVPLLILMGAEDTESAPDWCIDFAAQLEGNRAREFMLIPNTGHSYWNPGLPGYDAAAHQAAEQRLKAFLARHSDASP